MTEDEKQIKAYAFVDMMVDRGADYLIEGAPMWYGWALREAFLAGMKEAEHSDTTAKVPE